MKTFPKIIAAIFLVLSVGSVPISCKKIDEAKQKKPVGDMHHKVDSGPKFSVKFSGDGFADRNGSEVQVSVIDAKTNSPVSTLSAIIANGGFEISFPKVFAGEKSYYADVWVDIDGDVYCDNPPEDQAWRVELGEMTGDLEKTFTYNETYSVEACKTFK